MRFFRYFVIFLITLSFIGCSFSSSKSRVARVSAVSQSQFQMVTLRWYHVDSADGYFLYLEGEDGEIVYRDSILPSGCTHRKIAGYTAGVCSYQFDLSSFPLVRSVRVNAYEAVERGPDVISSD